MRRCGLLLSDVTTLSGLRALHNACHGAGAAQGMAARRAHHARATERAARGSARLRCRREGTTPLTRPARRGRSGAVGAKGVPIIRRALAARRRTKGWNREGEGPPRSFNLPLLYRGQRRSDGQGRGRSNDLCLFNVTVIVKLDAVLRGNVSLAASGAVVIRLA